MKQILTILCFISFILFVCASTDIVTTATTKGLYIWYNQLVPVILPFTLLSGLFLSVLNFEKLSKKQAMVIASILGLFCGYPIGAITLKQLSACGKLDKNFANGVLPLLNNVSPMFLISFIYKQYNPSDLSLFFILSSIYLPELIWSMIFILLKWRSVPEKSFRMSVPNNSECTLEIQEIIENSIHTITLIGMYICIFSIIGELLLSYLHSSCCKIMCCFLEITQGIPSLSALSINLSTKTALILSLVSFGGVSSLFQIRHIIKDSTLSFKIYGISKLVCALGTGLYVYILLL